MSHPDAEELFGAVDAATRDGRYASSVEIRLAILAELANLFRDGLDEEQCEALKIVLDMRDGGDGAMRDEYYLILTQKMDDIYRQIRKGTSTGSDEAKNRIVWLGVRHPNDGGLDREYAELITEVALEAGLRPEQIATAYEHHLPSFRNPFA